MLRLLLQQSSRILHSLLGCFDAARHFFRVHFFHGGQVLLTVLRLVHVGPLQVAGVVARGLQEILGKRGDLILASCILVSELALLGALRLYRFDEHGGALDHEVHKLGVELGHHRMAVRSAEGVDRLTVRLVILGRRQGWAPCFQVLKSGSLARAPALVNLPESGPNRAGIVSKTFMRSVASCQRPAVCSIVDLDADDFVTSGLSSSCLDRSNALSPPASSAPRPPPRASPRPPPCTSAAARKAPGRWGHPWRPASGRNP